MSFPRFILLLAVLCALPAMAIEPFVIKDIRIEGIQRTEAGTVFSYLPVKVGDTLTDDKAAQAIRALFATGFFKDVSLESDSGVLVVMVQERPSVAQIEFVGLKEFEKDQLLKGMRQIGMAEGRVFDKGLLDRAEQELKRQYLSRGMYSVSISTTVTPLERNRVSINFTVDEGAVAKIRQISIIGARVFKEKDLLALFASQPPGMMTWFTKNDQYSRQKLAGDIETLRSYYLDRGYLEFLVDSTQVSITPDKQDIYITISITEGDKYAVSDIKVGGEILIPEPEVLKLIKIKVGETFSRALLTESNKLISDRLGNEGYAFANVNAIPNLDKQKRQVAFTFFIDPGRRVYVRRINIAGNSITRDEVVRREMRQLEGGWYAADKISLSRSRVDKLGYFDAVNIETPAVQGTTDQVDLNVTVVEKPTGNVLLGAGFGSGEGVILSGAITKNNIFGSGKHVTAQVNSSKVNTVYALSYTDPYYTIDGISRGFDIYMRNLDANDNGLGQYKTETMGVAMRFGVPVTEKDIILYGIGYETTDITTYADSPYLYTNYVNTFGNDNSTILGTVGWVRDGRDSLIYPNSGVLQKAALEVGLPGGSLHYYKTSYQHQRYLPLNRTFTLMLNGEIGYGDGYDDKPLPFFKNYYVGGVGSVRGYKSFTIGPKNPDNTPTGGPTKLVGNVELLFPFPGMGLDKSVRLSHFIDAGTVGPSYATDDMRYSTGMSVLWVSPFGPLKVSVAKAIQKQPGDSTQVFQFSFGGAF